MDRVGIFGGTFNPLHKGHLGILQGAKHLFSLDRVYVVPTGESYHKNVGYLPKVEDRIELVRLALEVDPAFILSTVDLERGGPTYTVDTIRDIRKLEPTAELFLILGSDAFLDILSWKGALEIAGEVKFLVALRKGDYALDIEAFKSEAPAPFENKVFLFQWPIPDISSGGIKKRGLEKKHFPPGVYEYIKRKGLYPDDVR